jgi:hypothetical protein
VWDTLAAFATIWIVSEDDNRKHEDYNTMDQDLRYDEQGQHMMDEGYRTMDEDHKMWKWTHNNMDKDYKMVDDKDDN